jgi:molybdopterin biosynthesis enzyme
VRARTRVDDQGVHVDPVDGQDSHMITRAAGADALVLVRRGDGELRAGDQVSYLPI